MEANLKTEDKEQNSEFDSNSQKVSEHELLDSIKPLLEREARDRINVLLTLYYMARDPSKNSIAIDLDVSPSTVGRYCTIIEHELRISDVRKFAIEQGLDRYKLDEFKQIVGIEN